MNLQMDMLLMLLFAVFAATVTMGGATLVYFGDKRRRDNRAPVPARAAAPRTRPEPR